MSNKLATFSEHCPVACQARKKNPVARWLLKNTGRHVCPFCKAYEKKHGKPAYE